MRLLIAIALLFSITPGMSEVIEAGVHLIAHGDLQHHDADSAAGEHSCTPLAHHCGCHATMSAQPCSRVTNAVAFGTTTDLDPTALVAVFGRVTGPPPLRPPIA